jgi:hypothetical protein
MVCGRTGRQQRGRKTAEKRVLFMTVLRKKTRFFFI